MSGQEREAITVRQTKRGWDVERKTADTVYPTSSYANAGLAAARVLQLMELTQPITPQNWPERICIGEINGDPV